NTVGMNGGTPRSIMTDSNTQSDNKMALPSLAVKRSITVRKIAPRKTVALSEQNKENTPKPSRSEGIQQKKPKVSTPGPVPGRESSSSSAKKKKATMPSPILPSSPPPASHPPQMDPEDAVWSQKVRRSYSRLSEKSFNSPESRETLFGFEKLKTPEVRRAGVSKAIYVRCLLWRSIKKVRRCRLSVIQVMELRKKSDWISLRFVKTFHPRSFFTSKTKW
uniref:Uncharacterized protein n=1 Tax=Neolamprologus brichardi TaxID=32507 RepID=A0A3Q4H583_NEOBR